jgi:serine/threonine-protein kinase RsbW
MAPFKSTLASDAATNGAYRLRQIPSDPAEAAGIQEEVEKALKDHHFEDREVFGIKLALEEALINAIKHGNQLDQSKRVAVSYKVTGELFEVHIRDEGPGFNPDDVPNPMDPENLERPCGRGLFLMRHFMNLVVIHPPGNAVSLVKMRGVAANGKQ